MDLTFYLLRWTIEFLEHWCTRWENRQYLSCPLSWRLLSRFLSSHDELVKLHLITPQSPPPKNAFPFPLKSLHLETKELRLGNLWMVLECDNKLSSKTTIYPTGLNDIGVACCVGLCSRYIESWLQFDSVVWLKILQVLDWIQMDIVNYRKHPHTGTCYLRS